MTMQWLHRGPAFILGVVLSMTLGCQHDVDAFDGDGSGTGLDRGSTGIASGANETTGGPSGGDGDSGDASSSDDNVGDGFIFDLSTPDAGGVPSDDCECGSNAWSYLWVANSGEGTVSKINTRTAQEEGRYLTRPDGAGNPSRTSVSLNGHMTAVANRNGGVVSIWAHSDLCAESNGTPGIQTSTGKDDVLPWGEDECVAWYTPFDHYASQRPVAWGGQLDPETCRDTEVWTSGCNGYTDGRVWVHRLDGATGDVEASVELVGYYCGNFGGYGGATDSNGDYWMSPGGGGGDDPSLARVDRESMEYELFEVPPDLAAYGLTVDRKDRIWITSLGDFGARAGAARFDPATQQWSRVMGFWSDGGLQQGLDSRVWAAARFVSEPAFNGLAAIDTDSMTITDTIPIDGASIKGVSVDLDGFVWAVPLGTPGAAAQAHKFDADTLENVETYAGLTTPYTYSDMAGGQITNVACNPRG